MSVTQCRFCDHVNAAGAKFCSECGGALHLLPCPKCGAVSQVTAAVCYQCQAPLPWHTRQASEATAPPAEPPGSVARWRTTAIAGGALVVVLAGSAYYGFRGTQPEEPPVRSATDVTATGAVSAASKSVNEPIEPASASPTPVPEPSTSSDQASEPVKPLPRNRQAAKPPAAVPGAAPSARPGAERPATSGRPASLAETACSAATAALGLCVLAPGQAGRDAIVGAGVQAPGPQAPDAGQAAGDGSANRPTCTEAQAALGLCLPR